MTICHYSSPHKEQLGAVVIHLIEGKSKKQRNIIYQVSVFALRVTQTSIDRDSEHNS